MLSWVLLVLSASPPGMTVAVPDFEFVGLDPTLGGAYVERFATQLAGPGVAVTTQRDIRQLLGLERQQQLLGCADDGSSCLAELAGALGVQALVSGTVAKTESGYVATLRLLRTSDGARLQSASERLRDEAALLDWMDATAARFRGELQKSLGLEPQVPRRSLVRWAPGIAGGVLLAAGGASLVVALTQHQALVGGSLTNAVAIDGAVATGRTAEVLGYVLAGVGVAGLATSILWAALDGGDKPPVTLTVSPGGAALVFSARWP